MPEMSIRRPPTTKKWLVLRYGPLVVIFIVPMVVVGIRNHSWTAFGALVGAIAMIAFLTTVLAPRNFSKTQKTTRDLLEAAPPGTLFAGLASEQPKRFTSATRQQVGDRRLIRIDKSGVEWATPNPDYEAPEKMPWSSVRRIEVRCASPYAGFLDLHLANGRVRHWYIFDIPELVAAFDELKGDAVSPISD